MAKEKKEDFKSDWAYSEKLQKNIHISKARSGLNDNDYRCLGCHTLMVANIQKKNPHWNSYYSHHASNVNKDKPECIRANKKYRERIARTILNELKYVNAPTIYKLPFNAGLDLLPMKIESRKKITAAYTKAELTFYEDENGTVKWGKNSSIKEKNLLIRPDVTFFNTNDKPILFIEFIVTHKITPEKFRKLSRIGIDTLQIIIPRKSEEDIENALKSSRTYKWVYNEKEVNTEYISISRRDSEELSSINDDERILFEEDFKCRQAEINQLIRSIKRGLSSEQYRRTELDLNKQIQKVERNSEKENYELGDLEESHRREALGRNSNEEDKEDQQYRGLEIRYSRKDTALKADLITEADNITTRDLLSKSIKKERGSIQNITRFTERLRKRGLSDEAKVEEEIWREFGEEIKFEESEIKRIEREIRDLEQDLRATVARENKSIQQDLRFIREEQEYFEEAIFRELIGNIESEESEIKRIRKEEKSFKKSVRDHFDREVAENSIELTQPIRDLLGAQRFFRIYKDIKTSETRYRKARAFFKTGAWKSW
jgi:hypothetical protein